MDLRQYLRVVVFVDDGIGHPRCARGALALTTRGSRVVHLCRGPSLESGWHENPRHVAASFIHEILHTLGLGEDPPPPSYITARVLSRCKDPVDPQATSKAKR